MEKNIFEIGDVVKLHGSGNKLYEVIGFEHTYKKVHGVTSSTILYIIKVDGSYDSFKEKAYNLVYHGKKDSKEKDIDRMLDEYNRCLFESECNRNLFSLTGNTEYSLMSAKWHDQALAIMKELKLIKSGE